MAFATLDFQLVVNKAFTVENIKYHKNKVQKTQMYYYVLIFLKKSYCFIF